MEGPPGYHQRRSPGDEQIAGLRSRIAVLWEKGFGRIIGDPEAAHMSEKSPTRRSDGFQQEQASRKLGPGDPVPRARFRFLFPSHHLHPAQPGAYAGAVAAAPLSYFKRPILASGQ